MTEKLTAEKIPTSGTDDPTQQDQTLLAVNLLLQFFFREAQNNGLVRRFLIHRINKEMQEGIAKGGATVNSIIKGLKVKADIFDHPLTSHNSIFVDYLLDLRH